MCVCFKYICMFIIEYKIKISPNYLYQGAKNAHIAIVNMIFVFKRMLISYCISFVYRMRRYNYLLSHGVSHNDFFIINVEGYKEHESIRNHKC